MVDRRARDGGGRRCIDEGGSGVDGEVGQVRCLLSQRRGGNGLSRRNAHDGERVVALKLIDPLLFGGRNQEIPSVIEKGHLLRAMGSRSRWGML